MLSGCGAIGIDVVEANQPEAVVAKIQVNCDVLVVVMLIVEAFSVC